jgi:hypothetical protein
LYKTGWYNTNKKKEKPLMNVNSNEGFKSDPFKFGQVSGSLVDQEVEDGQEIPIRFPHHLVVYQRVADGGFALSSPQHLQTKQAHLPTLDYHIYNHSQPLPSPHRTNITIFPLQAFSNLCFIPS